ncbi:MAG: DNA repair protein RadC [Bacilli bacterium]|nr:DNA repair protein RadC [Bacilli bacterium]
MSTYKMKEIPFSERPRERLKEVGVENLTNIELLSILLKTGTKNKNVKDLALEVFSTYPLSDLKNISMEKLTTISGIGEVKAIELIACIELGKRIVLSRNKILKKLDTARDIWLDSKYLFYDKKQECFYCYYLDNKMKLIERKLIFMGTINASITHIREVFKEAYRVSATSIVCLHNHPSGDVNPSQADISFTKNLVDTGTIQGIPVVDHIIVSQDTFFSFYEENKI